MQIQIAPCGQCKSALHRVVKVLAPREKRHPIFTWVDGDRYDGELKDDKMIGRGIFTEYILSRGAKTLTTRCTALFL